MKEQINILILEKEPLAIYTYKQVLSNIKDYSFNTVTSNNYKFKIESPNNIKIDLLILSLPLLTTFKDEMFLAENFCVKIKEKYKNIKIMLFASKLSNYKINSIFRTINPDSLILKEEINFNKLQKAIGLVIKGTSYYSNTILCQLRRAITNPVNMDKKDRLLLYYLSVGVKIKDLPKLIHLSKGGVERRKRILKDTLNVQSGGDKALIKSAIEQGIL